VIIKLMETKPEINIANIDFEIKPYISIRAGKYYLRYKIAVKGTPPLKRALFFKILDGKGYYFFGMAGSSLIEKGLLTERDISMDGMVAYAANNSLYWLNKDNSEEKLIIKQE
jgi:hypothetical protein